MSEHVYAKTVDPVVVGAMRAAVRAGANRVRVVLTDEAIQAIAEEAASVARDWAKGPSPETAEPESSAAEQLAALQLRNHLDFNLNSAEMFQHLRDDHGVMATMTVREIPLSELREVHEGMHRRTHYFGDGCVPPHDAPTLSIPRLGISPPTPGKFAIVGEWLAQGVDACTCGPGDNAYGHEPGCGLEPVQKIEDLLAAAQAVARIEALIADAEQFVAIGNTPPAVKVADLRAALDGGDDA